MNHTDQNLYKDFVDESMELIRSSEELILSLEGLSRPDSSVVDTLFRAVHTIKGSAGLLGLGKINQLSHSLENIFSLARSGRLVFDRRCIDLLLESIDLLEKMILDLAGLGGIDILPIHNRLLRFYNDRANSEGEEAAELGVLSEAQNNLPSIDHDFRNVFIIESSRYITQIEDLLSEPDASGLRSNFGLVRSLLKSISLISSVLKLSNINKLCDGLNESLSYLSGMDGEDESCADVLLRAVYKLQMLVDDLDCSQQYEIDEEINELAGLIAVSVPPDVKTTDQVRPPVVQEQRPQASEEVHDVQTRETIRLDVALVDKLMRLAGELVLIRNQQIKRIRVDTPEIGLLLDRLNKTTSEIQETVMKSRLQPVSYIFSKYQRMVRDLSKQLGKEVELKIVEREVEIDKTYIDELSAPLTHLIRNALDHGIENPDERLQAKKSPVACISLEARQEASRINIIVSDDGRGINMSKIAASAVRLGLASESAIQSMQKNQILDMIWVPGFTTAPHVTDLSGRGVGMDVVHDTVSRLRGTIDVATEEGQGTSFSIRLPSTLSIVGSLILRTSGEYFAVPQINVAEMVRVEEHEFKERVVINQEGMYLNLRGAILPLEGMNHILQHPGDFADGTRPAYVRDMHECKLMFPLTIIVLKSGRGKFCLLIDQYIGSEEIVVQSLHPKVSQVKIYSGSTVLGNGKLAFVLNVENISHLVGVQYSNLALASDVLEGTVESSIDDLLFVFRYGEQELFALPLVAIRHILSFKASALQKIGTNRFVAVGDDIYRVVGMDDLMELQAEGGGEELFLILFKGFAGKCGLLAPVILGTEKEASGTKHSLEVNRYIIHSTIIQQRVCMVLDADALISLVDPKY